MQTVYVYIGCYEIHINVKSEWVQKITLSDLYKEHRSVFTSVPSIGELSTYTVLLKHHRLFIKLIVV